MDRAGMLLGILGPQADSRLNRAYIISTGRTGTKFMADFLNRFPEVYAIHEPKPYFLSLGIEFCQGRPSFNKAVKVIESKRRALIKDARRRRARMLVESNNRLFSLIPVLRELQRGCKIIHIARDGRDYVRSGMSRGWYSKTDKSPRLKACDFLEDSHRNHWNAMTRFEKISWQWQKKDGYIFQQVRYDPNAITIKFEDIFKDKHFTGLMCIAGHLGLDRHRAKILARSMVSQGRFKTKKYTIPKWQQWNQELVDQFKAISGGHFKNYGYKW